MRFVEEGDPGASSVLVLVHAFPVGVRLFEPQRHAFPGWRLIAPALPGFDGTDLLERPSTDEYARNLLALLDELRIDRAVFGGVSLGGYLTFAVLRRAAHRVAGVILADTRSEADGDAARPGRERLMQIARESGPAAVATDMVPKLLGRTSQDSRPDLVAHVRNLIEGQTRDGIAAAIHVLMERPDSTPLLSGINVPALVIVGAEDVLTPPPEMERMAAAIPGAEFVRIQDAGHLANLENAAAFNAAVRTFLEPIRM